MVEIEVIRLPAFLLLAIILMILEVTVMVLEVTKALNIINQRSLWDHYLLLLKCGRIRSSPWQKEVKIVKPQKPQYY
jgi:hypothetical protein